MRECEGLVGLGAAELYTGRVPVWAMFVSHHGHDEEDVSWFPLVGSFSISSINPSLLSTPTSWKQARSTNLLVNELSKEIKPLQYRCHHNVSILSAQNVLCGH